MYVLTYPPSITTKTIYDKIWHFSQFSLQKYIPDILYSHTNDEVNQFARCRFVKFAWKTVPNGDPIDLYWHIQASLICISYLVIVVNCPFQFHYKILYLKIILFFSKQGWKYSCWHSFDMTCHIIKMNVTSEVKLTLNILLCYVMNNWHDFLNLFSPHR